MTLEEYMRELVLMSRQYGREEELYPLVNMMLRESDNAKHISIRDVHNCSEINKISGKNKRIMNEMLYGYASYPDLVLLDENCDLREKKDTLPYTKQYNYLLGCVEVKSVSKNLVSEVKQKEWKIKWVPSNYYYKKDNRLTDFGQILGEILWYGKILYTNGKVWYYLELQQPQRENIIKNIEEFIGRKKTQKWLGIQEDNAPKEGLLKEETQIEILCVNIGNLKSIYKKIINATENEEHISESAIRQQFKQKDVQEWNRLKYNLASINWCGSNKADQFK